MSMDTSGESSALLRQAQAAMECSVARLKERLRLFAADSLKPSDVTMRWWARQSEALHTGLELRLIRWRARRMVRRLPQTGACGEAEAKRLQESLDHLFERYRHEVEKRLEHGSVRSGTQPSREGRRSSCLLHN